MARTRHRDDRTDRRPRREAEARIKQTLPLAAREWIVLLDDLDRLGGWERVLRDCRGRKKVPHCLALALLTSGENDGHWGPMLRDLDKETRRSGCRAGLREQRCSAANPGGADRSARWG